MGSRAAGTPSNAHMGSWHMQEENFVTRPPCRAQQVLFGPHDVEIFFFFPRLLPVLEM